MTLSGILQRAAAHEARETRASPSRMMPPMPTTTVRPVASESEVPPTCTQLCEGASAAMLGLSLPFCHLKRSRMFCGDARSSCTGVNVVALKSESSPSCPSRHRTAQTASWWLQGHMAASAEVRTRLPELQWHACIACAELCDTPLQMCPTALTIALWAAEVWLQLLERLPASSV